MKPEEREIFERMAGAGHSPSAQAQNLAAFAALMLAGQETTPILDDAAKAGSGEQ